MAGSLLVIGVLLIVFNVIALKKDKKSFKETFTISEKDITEFDIKIGELRREFSETILELQKEIVNLKEEMNIKSQENNIAEVENINEFNELEMKSGRLSVDFNNLPEYKYGKSTYLFNNDNNKEHNRNEEENHHDANEYKIVEQLNKEEEKQSEYSNNTKVNEIKELLDKGISIEEIAEKLSMGKGEVLLIKELYIK